MCCRFHLLKPDYVHHRIKELQRSFRLRLLICHIDVEDVVEPLAQVIKAALLNEVTLICGWSPEVMFQSACLCTRNQLCLMPDPQSESVIGDFDSTSALPCVLLRVVSVGMSLCTDVVESLAAALHCAQAAEACKKMKHCFCFRSVVHCFIVRRLSQANGKTRQLLHCKSASGIVL